MLLPAYNFTGT
uniref:Uncharacterized protein n=1 Tax=Arundo donax TaxID=35708 RepID=A0A0A9GSY5_ARUDO